MKDINIILGRFQPFTLGHLKCCEHAMKVKNVPSVICMIETKVSDAKHPFLSTDLLPMLKDLPEKLIEDVVLVRSADIVKLTEMLHEQGYNPISWTCGSDRIETYTRQATRYGEKAGLPSDFEVLEVPRSDEDISATKVREALKSGDKKTFEKMMPKESHKYFDKLSETIKSLKESKTLKSFLLEYLVNDINVASDDEEANSLDDANVILCKQTLEIDGKYRTWSTIIIHRDYLKYFKNELSIAYCASRHNNIWDIVESIYRDHNYKVYEYVELYWCKYSRSGLHLDLFTKSRVSDMINKYVTVTDKTLYKNLEWNTWLKYCGTTMNSFIKKK